MSRLSIDVRAELKQFGNSLRLLSKPGIRDPLLTIRATACQFYDDACLLLPATPEGFTKISDIMEGLLKFSQNPDWPESDKAIEAILKHRSFNIPATDLQPMAKYAEEKVMQHLRKQAAEKVFHAMQTLCVLADNGHDLVEYAHFVREHKSDHPTDKDWRSNTKLNFITLANVIGILKKEWAQENAGILPNTDKVIEVVLSEITAAAKLQDDSFVPIAPLKPARPKDGSVLKGAGFVGWHQREPSS